MNPSFSEETHPTLDPSPDEIQRIGQAAVRVMADYYGGLRDRAILPSVTSAGSRADLAADLPVEGSEFDALLRTIEEKVFASSRHNGHPRFFGYVASPGTAASALADMLASVLNANVTSWRSAPGPTEIERIAVGWIRQIVGYPAESDGLFVSGGSMANLCGLAAARDAMAPAPVTRLGCRELERPLRIYMSDEGHHSIVKAAGLLGIGRDNVRLVPTDEAFRLDLDALERMIIEDRDRGAAPSCVVGSAGTVTTGAVDDLAALADVAERHGLWLHVDACYGGFAMLAPSKRPLFRGIDRADSVALDPHKWLYVPLDCGCVLYRDPARARAVFGHEAEYTRVLDGEGDEAYAFWDYSPELSRRFRALKVWMMLSHVGTRALGEAIERNCHRAETLAQLVEESDDFEMLAPVALSIFCFRRLPRSMRRRRPEALGAGSPRPASGRATGRGHPAPPVDSSDSLDELNQRLLTELQRSGSSYLSNALVRGRFALRGCVLNFRTTEADMGRLLEDVRAAARKVGG